MQTAESDNVRIQTALPRVERRAEKEYCFEKKCFKKIKDKTETQHVEGGIERRLRSTI